MFLFLLTIVLLPPLVYSKGASHIYSTGTTMEVDRCASAWLIKRFVDEDAIFRFFPDGELIKKGIAFDTPDAALRRTHNASTFENILHHYNLSDKRLSLLAEYIHDIEINFWGKRKKTKSYEMEKELLDTFVEAKDNEDRLSACFQYFDHFIHLNSQGEVE